MAGSRDTRASTKRNVVRRRAVGTRDRITAHLAAVAEVNDPTGMASTRLAEAVGYPGSSVAFAQLLSGMERDGLIAREVRGKRTYRISLTDAGPGDAAAAGEVAIGAGHVPGPAPAFDGFDYDQLARRLLIQVVRRLAVGPDGQQDTVAGLERELVAAWTKHGTLTEENLRLREQLREAHRNLDQMRQRGSRLDVTDELDKAEVMVLERLLAPAADSDD